MCTIFMLEKLKNNAVTIITNRSFKNPENLWGQTYTLDKVNCVGLTLLIHDVPLEYTILPVHPFVASPETRVNVAVPFPVLVTTNWPEELIDHAWMP